MLGRLDTKIGGVARLTYADANDGYEDDLTMDIITAELEWVDADNGGLLEIASEFLSMSIEEQGSLGDPFPWQLCIDVSDDYQKIADRVFLPGGGTTRNCVDLEHAFALAEACEREAFRRATA